MAHSQKVRAIAEAKIKTDKIDSHVLAQLLRTDLIPAAYIPGKQTRSYKEMIRQRVFLVRMRTRLKNRIHVLLDRLHVPLPSVTNIFGKRGTDYLRKLNLPGVDGEILRENLQLLEAFNTLIKEAEREIELLLDMNMVQENFDPTVFTKNRERLMEHEVGRLFFDAVVGQARQAGLMSDDHFTVDGTLIEAWASLKSFRPKGEKPSDRPTDGDPGNPTVDFHGRKRSNETHESTTDPESRLMRKGRGKEGKLSYGAHLLMENRHGMLVDIQITQGTAEPEGAESMLKRQARKGIKAKTLGADKGYDTREFVKWLRKRKITPQVAQNARGSAIDGRTTRHPGYGVSQRIRKRVEEIGGWIKTIGGFRKSRFKEVLRTQLAGWFVGAAYNLLRMAKLKALGVEV